jgi:hypothetical protein
MDETQMKHGYEQRQRLQLAYFVRPDSFSLVALLATLALLDLLFAIARSVFDP